jgi:hypothetical protein
MEGLPIINLEFSRKITIFWGNPKISAYFLARFRNLNADIIVSTLSLRIRPKAIIAKRTSQSIPLIKKNMNPIKPIPFSHSMRFHFYT